ncbi:response regulator [Aliikangiella coralliicola]|uniref:Response regulator n=1 Tax=Aliikangiella coralliicola TaxID=2592383 RepID=A0A545UHW2_9GAMM|nr:response regulator [Aliikangiella coralliicola]TQV89039.1 response regulator [Aliikangiella coralliicola]
MAKKLLFVEDSALVLKVMRRLVVNAAEFKADFAESYAQAETFIGNNPQQYFAAVVDLNLPDAPKGEVVDLVLSNKIPTLVLTATYDENKRNELYKKGIVDYVVKENRYSYDYAMKLIIRLSRNHAIKVMVVDDSLVARKQASNLLKKYLFQVVEADGAKQAIRALIDEPDIKLVITDYHMPDVDGFELVKLLRGKYDKHDLTIIGLSGEGDASLSARFIKNGANDFLRKPFNQEEFYCRVMHNIESLEAIETIKDAANRDYLTGLYNRQHFYQLANAKIGRCQESGDEYSMAIIEIDDFREFNNVFSEYGDTVLIKFAKELHEKFSQFITARLNGSQLVAFLWGISLDDCHHHMNDLRERIKELSIDTDSGEQYLSVSVGLSHSGELTLRQMLEDCDELISRAQEAGKDLVLYD